MVVINCIFCIAEAVGKNKLFAAATEKQIEEPAKDWFRFAKDRSGGRKERRDSKKAQAANSVTDLSNLSGESSGPDEG